MQVTVWLWGESEPQVFLIKPTSYITFYYLLNKVWAFFLHNSKDIEKEDRKYVCFYIFGKILSKIYVNNAWFYSFHGCLHEESVIGAEYLVNIMVETNTDDAEKNDNLKSTVDYVDIYNAIKAEMDKPSKLLESVMDRMIVSIKGISGNITVVDVSIKKLSPPIGGNVDSVELRKKV